MDAIAAIHPERYLTFLQNIHAPLDPDRRRQRPR